MRRIVLYSTDFCSYCHAAKALLRTLDIPYDEMNLTADAGAREELRRLTGKMTFPQLIIDGESIGGYRELAALVAQGSLKAETSSRC